MHKAAIFVLFAFCLQNRILNKALCKIPSGRQKIILLTSYFDQPPPPPCFFEEHSLIVRIYSFYEFYKLKAKWTSNICLSIYFIRENTRPVYTELCFGIMLLILWGEFSFCRR
jgi:hypothetical protein